MPKEITYTNASAFLLVGENEYSEGSDEANKYLGTGQGKWRRRGVHVGWVKGKYVELGAASFDPSRELPSDGVFMSLDRDGINRLIKSLRKARDQAFGADA